MLQRVTIEKLVFGGYGLARTDAGVVFVTGAAPGETVFI
jgi:tRNA/tmRNA/rRNA uracil-C5-methylase (TrmA/RlmC/RlmD family)